MPYIRSMKNEASCDLTNPIFFDEDAAREHFAALRWPNGPVCPFCNEAKTVKKLGGTSMGPGWFHCTACRRKFTALVGTVFHRSHIPLHKWLLAAHLLAASKKSMSALQLSRMLGLAYRSSWFMAMRLREAMGPLPGFDPEHSQAWCRGHLPQGQRKVSAAVRRRVPVPLQ